MSFPNYPEYKNSGVGWLRAVPSHWEVLAGRRLFSQQREPRKHDDEQLSATQKYGVLPQTLFMQLEDQKVTLALNGLDNFKHVEVDDFVISLRSFQGGIEWSRYSGCVSPAYTVLRPSRSVTATYWSYALKSVDYIGALQSVTDGIRDGKNIGYDQFGMIGLPYPTIQEQSAIAAFLDRETAKIDALVAEQEKLIELLKEKRQAVISHAVTKGLDPNVPMKDSCVEWLGEVPEHWSIIKVSHLFSAKKGSNAAQLTKEYCAEIDGEHPVYSGQTDNNGVMACINEYEFDTGTEGVILSTTVGAKAMSISHINGKFSLSQNCMIITSKSKNASIRFFYYHFHPP
ncbi:restriction endonuclease subunit S domain-containing protein [Desulfomicrobium salsuginis]